MLTRPAVCPSSIHVFQCPTFFDSRGLAAVLVVLGELPWQPMRAPWDFFFRTWFTLTDLPSTPFPRMYPLCPRPYAVLALLPRKRCAAPFLCPGSQAPPPARDTPPVRIARAHRPTSASRPPRQQLPIEPRIVA